MFFIFKGSTGTTLDSSTSCGLIPHTLPCIRAATVCEGNATDLTLSVGF